MIPRLICKHLEDQTLAERLASELPKVESIQSIEVRCEPSPIGEDRPQITVVLRLGPKFTFELRDVLRARTRSIVKNQQPNADLFIRFP